uniref:ATP-dependent DNA helicase n=1 Tax=Setaria italica TaxID=4555 RepID=K3YLZ3_SETIT
MLSITPMLTKYFEANKNDPRARGILYHDFPEFYSWKRGKQAKFWQKRKRKGLIEADNTLDECLTEAETFQMPSALRRLFATILVFCNPSNVPGLWNKHLDAMSEDYRRTMQSTQVVQQLILIDMRNILATYDENLAAVNSGEGGMSFVDGPRGTGKTFLYKALLTTVHNRGKVIVAMATSGDARRKDEVSMTKRQAVEALDISMRDIMSQPDQPFGGKAIVFGGDFRQVLPVVQKGSRAQIVDASLRRSYLWECMCHLKLVRNMRAQSDPWFAEYLLRVGNGTEEDDGNGHICLRDEISVPYMGEDTDLGKLIEDAFPMLHDNMTDPNYIVSRAILSTRNDYEMVYHSFDPVEDDPRNYYPQEILNSLAPNGLPPHVLKLKVNCPIILLRNIDPANGLCNGTRKRVFLPRISLYPSDDDDGIFPFRFKRKQFPVRLSFAMTINKAQGQTILHAGVYLPEPVFSHGQLYVALSRATARVNIKVLATIDKDKTKKHQIQRLSIFRKLLLCSNFVCP